MKYQFIIFVKRICMKKNALLLLSLALQSVFVVASASTKSKSPILVLGLLVSDNAKKHGLSEKDISIHVQAAMDLVDADIKKDESIVTLSDSSSSSSLSRSLRGCSGSASPVRFTDKPQVQAARPQNPSAMIVGLRPYNEHARSIVAQVQPVVPVQAAQVQVARPVAPAVRTEVVRKRSGCCIS